MRGGAGEACGLHFNIWSVRAAREQIPPKVAPVIRPPPRREVENWTSGLGSWWVDPRDWPLDEKREGKRQPVWHEKAPAVHGPHICDKQERGLESSRPHPPRNAAMPCHVCQEANPIRAPIPGRGMRFKPAGTSRDRKMVGRAVSPTYCAHSTIKAQNN